MSLAEQQWLPTSAQVTVIQARNLRIKGKNGTNDAYAIMQVAKDKFSTSVSEKSISPQWKEEATFDLPQAHLAGVERHMLYVTVMHRALVGLDKFLGQAVINLMDLHANRARKKSDWYKLVDKNGKQEKDRGEVLLDIQFMRNNMTASMLDLSMTDKPRSGISKLKDKIRGKKKEGLSDSASAIIPPMAGSDSEGEDGTDSPKRKSKLKLLFGPKTNLQKNVSQSMSTLGSLPEKNSSLTGSRSSGINVDSPEVKKKFHILGHKRSGSTDSKVSLGPFSLLSRSKQNIPEPNSLCINGNHVYSEEQEPRATSDSSLSLNSFGKGSVEEMQNNHQRNVSDMSVDSLKGLSVPSYKAEGPEKSSFVLQRPLEEGAQEEKNTKRQDGLQERLERQTEEPSKRHQELDKKEVVTKKTPEPREHEEEERHKKKMEEESRVTERLSSLFGIGRKKEERKEVEGSKPMSSSTVLNGSTSVNPFEDIPLSPDSLAPVPERPSDPQKNLRTPFTFMPLSRTAKVSAVKPRLAVHALPETNNSLVQTPSNTETHSSSSFPRHPFETFHMFSDLHSSLAPAKPQRTFASENSSRNGMEQLSGVDSASKTEKKRRAPLPPGNNGLPPKTGVSQQPENRQLQRPKGSPRPTLPLPDYDTLFPKKKHGVMSQSRWEHIIAEVNQRNWDLSEEMNVDEPQQLSRRHHQNPEIHESPHASKLRNKQAIMPPKGGTVRDQESVYATVNKPRTSADGEFSFNVSNPSVPQEKKALTHSSKALNEMRSQTTERPTPATRVLKNIKADHDRAIPTITPRQQLLLKEKQTTAQPVPLLDPVGNVHRDERKSPSNVDQWDSKGEAEDPFTAKELPFKNISNEAEFFRDPFANDPWTVLDQNTSVDGKGLRERSPDDYTSTLDGNDSFENFSTSEPKFELDKRWTNFTEQDQPSLHSSSQEYPTKPIGRSTSREDVELTVTSVSPPCKAEMVPETFEPSVAGGKSTLRAWVSPSETPSLNGNAGFNPRRPHLVKPMSTTESQSTIVQSTGKDLKTLTIQERAEKSKSSDNAPYTQLTQEELITLVVKQQTELSRKDGKILELEDYIDNLLVRVIEEKPSILLSLSSKY